jgi:hypothetical protein
VCAVRLYHPGRCMTPGVASASNASSATLARREEPCQKLRRDIQLTALGIPDDLWAAGILGPHDPDNRAIFVKWAPTSTRTATEGRSSPHEAQNDENAVGPGTPR